MAFSNSRDIDARHSSFNQAGRDWHQTHYNTTNYSPTVHISFSLFGYQRVESSHHHPLTLSDATQPVPRTMNSSPRRLVKTHRSSDTISVNEIADDLIVQIIDRLVDRRNSSNSHWDVQLQLDSLRQALSLTGLAIEAYGKRPLGQSLAHVITPEVERCFVILQKLLRKVDSTRLGLNATDISNLWYHVWRSRWDGDEFVLLKKKLSDSQQSLDNFMMALHSVSLMELGNELHAGPVSLQVFHNLLNRHLPFLGHIKLDAVYVESHLGDTIPVPTIFCFTWKDLDYIVQGHCKDRIGNRLIQRGDYNMMRVEDSQIVGPSEIAHMVESGMKLQMNIVLRQRTAFRDAREKCPRCHHINSHAIVDRGWTEWKVSSDFYACLHLRNHCSRKCSGQFQVAEVHLGSHIGESNPRGDTEHRGMVDEARRREGHTEDADEEIISHESQAEGSASVIEQSQRQDNNATHNEGDTQFFRRIHVICMNYDTIPLVVIDAISGEKEQFDYVDDRDIIIAIMGATGTGKSSFINLAVGNDRVPVSHDFNLPMSGVQAVKCIHPDNPNRNVIFLDTPGFDGPHQTDAEVLITIAKWLNTTYERGIMLTGLLFLHRISDNRMSGTSVRNKRMFEILCGTGALQNVILVTTMWDTFDKVTGSSREDELRTNFWSSMVTSGARMARFGNTYSSAWQILDQFGGVSCPLQLQREMVDEGKSLVHTAAGSALFQWLDQLVLHFRAMIARLRSLLHNVPNDSEAAVELLREKFTAQQGLRKADAQKTLLSSGGTRRSMHLPKG